MKCPLTDMFTSLYVTTADLAEAKKLANAAVEARLAACANLFPIESVYHWEGELCNDSEVALLFKTRRELVDQLMEFLDKLHSYEVPCMVALPWERAHLEYADWVGSQTDEGGGVEQTGAEATARQG